MVSTANMMGMLSTTAEAMPTSTFAIVGPSVA